MPQATPIASHVIHDTVVCPLLPPSRAWKVAGREEQLNPVPRLTLPWHAPPALPLPPPTWPSRTNGVSSPSDVACVRLARVRQPATRERRYPQSITLRPTDDRP